jgi:hypothetical protein
MSKTLIWAIGKKSRFRFDNAQVRIRHLRLKKKTPNLQKTVQFNNNK